MKSNRLRLAPKTTEAKPLTFAQALKLRERLRRDQDRDPQYQALRLRGLAGLIRACGDGSLAEVTNLDEVTFFLASVVDEVAECLSPNVS
jgi:hypothetical protein